MKPLEDMTVGHRIVLTFIVVLVILFVLAIVGFMSGRWDEAPAAPQGTDLYGDTPIDATLLKLDRRALDEAYHAQLLKLWGVWLADGARDPKHFKNGLGNARRAYGLALEAITKREQDLAK
jgi:hypothetical protein